MTIRLLIGGATTSRVHTTLRIEPAYSGPTLHVLDASRAVGVATALTSETQRDALVRDTASEYAMIREERAGKAESKLVGIEAARANGFSADFSEFKPHRPSFIGTKAIDDVPGDKLIH